jgi:DNA-binding NarL/FixJ family response regulator
VVAEAQDGKAAIARPLETQPDVAIIEYYLPFLNGAEVTRQIRAQLPSTEVLIFTVHDDDRVVREILTSGARLRAEIRRQHRAGAGRRWSSARADQHVIKTTGCISVRVMHIID